MPRGIDPEFAAEIAIRRAQVERRRAEADAAWVEFRTWVLEQWLNEGRGSAVAVAEALGVNRARLYQIRDRYRELGRLD
jgi:DNA-binding NtrC family response regulator